MARHINTNNKKFLVDLQALIRKSYSNSSGINVNDIEPDPELEFIEPDSIDPIEPIIPEKPTNTKKRFVLKDKNALKIQTEQMDAFEAEYQAFIAKLKARKENKNTEEISINEDTTTEPVVDMENPSKKRIPINRDLKIEETMEK